MNPPEKGGTDAPAPRSRKRLPLSGLSGAKCGSGWKGTLLALLGAAAITGGVFWGISKSADETMVRRGYFDNEVTLPPGKEFGYVLVVALSSSYEFRVRPEDGAVVMAVGRLDDGDGEKMSDRDLAAALRNASVVEPGKTGRESGEFSRGRYGWVVANPSKEKPVRVRINFG